MLDSLFILIFVMSITFYFVGFNYDRGWRNFIVGVVFIALGFMIFTTGWQSSNTTIGTFHANDVNSSATDFSFTPQTYVGNLTQTEDANYEAGVTIIAAFMAFLGVGMVIGRDRKPEGEQEE